MARRKAEREKSTCAITVLFVYDVELNMLAEEIHEFFESL